MLRGYNRPRRSDIFGPSNTGGSMRHVRPRELYQEGEGIGSFFSSIFRKLIPFAAKAAKTVAGSSLVKETGKAVRDTALSGLTDMAADVIGGKKTFQESAAENLAKARDDIATAIKDNRKRGSDNVKAKVTRAKGNKKRKKTRMRYSVFDDKYG